MALILDEHDAPILDSLNKEILPQIKELLRSFYKSIKANEQYLIFTFITGISKFSKLGVFSAMNNLDDITLSPTYSTIVGYP